MKNIRQLENTPNSVPLSYDLRDIIICGMRYALGRHTYVVKEIADYIGDHLEIFDRRSLVIIRDDLRRFIRDNKYLADDIDYPIWKSLLAKVEDFYGTNYKPFDEIEMGEATIAEQKKKDLTF